MIKTHRFKNVYPNYFQMPAKKYPKSGVFHSKFKDFTFASNFTIRQISGG